MSKSVRQDERNVNSTFPLESYVLKLYEGFFSLALNLMFVSVFELLSIKLCLTGKVAVRGGRNGRFTLLLYHKRIVNVMKIISSTVLWIFVQAATSDKA